MFWVADAPQHPGDEQKVHDIVLGAEQKGIHIYPVASSDADGSAEMTMRDAAQYTGGRRYLFLTTDDSGVGNSHAEPHNPVLRRHHARHRDRLHGRDGDVGRARRGDAGPDPPHGR